MPSGEGTSSCRGPPSSGTRAEVAGLLTTRKELEALFDELAAELDRGRETADIVVVGGAWMLWHAKRVSTKDVDSARRLDDGVRRAVRTVARRRELAGDWLNDGASGFWPSGTRLDECEVVYERGGLTVRTPTPDVMFVMKLYRAQPHDREDMIEVWPMCKFSSPLDAVRAFRAAYPHAPDDPFLVEYVEAIAADARHLGPPSVGGIGL